MELFPVIAAPRALVPGTRMSIRAGREDLQPGDRLVIVLRRPGATDAGAVGTVATLLGMDQGVAGGAVMLVDGDRLVRLVDPVGNAGSLLAGTSDIDGVTGSKPKLIATAQTSLKRYMATSAEAGEGGDVHISLSTDPVVASHEVASRLRLTSPELQEILESGRAAERLQRSIAVMRRETALLVSLLGRKES